MARLQVRCKNRNVESYCRMRATIPDTPRNRHRLEHGDAKCKACGYDLVWQNRAVELSRRERCNCDGVQWADMRGSPHDVNTPGCKQYEDWLMESRLTSTKPRDSGEQEPPF